MRVQGNWLSLVSWRAFSRNSASMDVSSRKLAAGVRIGTASDDVAGLAISQNFLKQYRGLLQGNRNAMDGISLLNTAESALQEIHQLLNRGRELSLQAANGTLTTTDRTSIQVETTNLLAEIDRIADTTAYNGRKLFNASGVSAAAKSVVYGIRSGWFEQTADLIEQYYGLTGDGSTLTVDLSDGGGSTAAWITGDPSGANGVLDNLVLHVNLRQFGTESVSPNGVFVSDDRKIARALTQAVLARSTAFVNLPSWFISGVSDYLAGMDEELQASITQYGLAAIIDAIDDPTWVDDSLHRASGYLAVKYLEFRFGPGTLKDVISLLSLANGGGGTTLNDAFGALSLPDLSTYLAEFQDATPTGGAAFAATLLLADPIVGSVNNQDDRGAIPDGGTYSEDPLLPQFDVEVRAGGLFDPTTISFLVGANVQDRVDVAIPHVSALSLGLLGIDVTRRAAESIDLYSRAIATISSVRSELGSASGRLETTMRANNLIAQDQISSYSRITDLDFAKELTSYTRQQILLSSSGAALAQANAARQNVKWLLNGLAVGGGSRASPAFS